MRVRTLLAITLTMFALPALAAETPKSESLAVPTGTPLMLPPVATGTATDATGNPDVSVVFEVRTLKVPAGFCERAGVKPTGDAVFGDDDVRKLLAAAQAIPDASVMQFPKVTAEDGKTVTVHNREERLFVTGIDAKRVKGATVLVPRNTSVELGDTLTLCGQVSRDAQTVTVKVALERTRVAGSVELIPVITQITPVFEGGAQGKPIPFTQYVQSPDIRTEKVEKHVIISSGHTVVLGSWKETEPAAEQPARARLFPKKEKPPTEYEVVAFATVRVLRDEEISVAPMPREAGTARAYPLRNVAAAEAACAVANHLKGKNLEARLTYDVVTNTVFVSACPAVTGQVFALLAGIDVAPTQVMMQATVVQVPRGFLEASGLSAGGDPAKGCTLSPRETRMLTAILRSAKEKGELDVLARPQVQVADNQTGFVQIGQNFPVETRSFVKTADGRVMAEATIEYVPTGVLMRLTPRVSTDGKSILLRTEGQLITVSPSPVTLGNSEDPQDLPAPVFNTQQVNATAEVRSGETAIFAMVGGGTGGRSFLGELRRRCAPDKFETLVIITPAIVTPAQGAQPAGGPGK